MKQTVETTLRQMFKDYLGEISLDIHGEISHETHLKDDLGLDSLDILVILMQIEKSYNFDFTSKEEETLTYNPTFGNFVEVIYKKIR